MVSEITGRYSGFIEEVFVGVYKREPEKKTQWGCRREEITPWFPKCVKFVRYTPKSAQVVTDLQTSCNTVIVKPISGSVRTVCFQLL
jgi:hypothetical protein